MISRCLAAVAALLLACPALAGQKGPAPNIIFILADDLGYGQLGCYGQQMIQTPHLDRMAAEGMRFTDCYAGSTVCAPSRCCLMTGLSTGHARIRGNALVPLEPGDVTVAEVLKKAGYTTALIGKWGLGEAESTGVPTRQGFDSFFGYLNQVHAHNSFPDFLWRNEEKVALRNEVTPVGNSFGGVASKRVEFSNDLFAKEALEFVDRQGGRPFFLYLALTIPHANNEGKDKGMEVPDLGPYADKDWPEFAKCGAAMITRMDGYVGRLLARLNERALDGNTVVFFTSDNGPHKEGGFDPAFFNSSGPLQGIKRSLHDGGIRVPMIVRWPGHVAPGKTCDLPWAFWDFLATAADLAGVPAPADSDGISIVPTLLGKGDQKRHEFLYWEFHEGNSQQAVRMGPWKAIRSKPGAAMSLYNLQSDLAEATDVAAAHPDIVAKIEAYLKSARSQSDHWPLATRAKGPGKKVGGKPPRDK